ncbi:YbaB/EbfC family nucleoid-associated protein [bacterium]|nr:YbaB/EbfC family nucleoid-associated protein [candidate division CSSED10-310 bacterium]
MKFMNFVKQAQEMVANMEKLREQVKQKTVTVEVGGGLVIVTANGENELLAVKIKPEAMDQEDPTLLEDLVISAVNEAMRQVKQLVQQEMGTLTKGMNLPDLGNLKLPDQE